jgi:hypothetical protein
LFPEIEITTVAVPSLSGPFNLTKDGINSAVPNTSAGVYALGYVQGNTFYIQRVGRSDVNLNKRIHDYEGQYKQFKAAYSTSPYQAFLGECELWHEYGNSTNNPLHPDRPAGTDWKCPRCKNFG